MLAKNKEHQKAIHLRKLGKSYSEICAIVPVSQSVLSSWLKNVALTEKQIELINLKKRNGQSKGGLLKRFAREQRQKEIIEKAAAEVNFFSMTDLWLAGTIAYWCEGSKQKENNVSQGVTFSNSDLFLIKLFLKWLREICQVNDNEITYSLYIHESADIKKVLDYWTKVLNIPEDKFGKPILKKHNILTKRKNVNKDYFGLVRISVKKSTDLNRKINGWVLGINNLL